MDFSDRFIAALVWHLVADWLLQNHWMSINKHRLTGAAYAHGGIHLLGLLFVLPPPIAVIVTALHMLIDTRLPIRWWRATIRQTGSMHSKIKRHPSGHHHAINRTVGYGMPLLDEINLILNLVTDQVLHIAVLALACGAVTLWSG